MHRVPEPISRVATDQEVVRENDILKKSQGTLKQCNTADLIVLKTGRNICVTVISTIFFLSGEGKFVRNLLVA